MHFDELYPSRFLKSDDFETGPMQFTIASIKPEQLNGERRVLCTFKDTDKQLVLNKTNARALARMYGNDTRNWLGKTVTLVATEVDFKGDLVPAVRIKVTPPKHQSAPSVDDDPAF